MKSDVCRLLVAAAMLLSLGVAAILPEHRLWFGSWTAVFAATFGVLLAIGDG